MLFVGRLPGDQVATTPCDFDAWWLRPGEAFISHPLADGDVAWEAVVNTSMLGPDSGYRCVGACSSLHADDGGIGALHPARGLLEGAVWGGIPQLTPRSLWGHRWDAGARSIVPDAEGKKGRAVSLQQVGMPVQPVDCSPSTAVVGAGQAARVAEEGWLGARVSSPGPAAA